MCGLYTSKTTTAWLSSQLRVLDAWVLDLSDDPTTNPYLFECVSEHRKWLSREIDALRDAPNDAAATAALAFGT